jgi:hypothetical protein
MKGMKKKLDPKNDAMLDMFGTLPCQNGPLRKKALHPE